MGGLLFNRPHLPLGTWSCLGMETIFRDRFCPCCRARKYSFEPSCPPLRQRDRPAPTEGSLEERASSLSDGQPESWVFSRLRTGLRGQAWALFFAQTDAALL